MDYECTDLYSHTVTDAKCPQTVNSSYRNSWTSNKKLSWWQQEDELASIVTVTGSTMGKRSSSNSINSRTIIITTTTTPAGRPATAFLMAIRNSSTAPILTLIQFSMILVMSPHIQRRFFLSPIFSIEKKWEKRKEKILAKKVWNIKELNISFQFTRI